MEFDFNDEQLAFKEMAANFAREKLMPNAAKWDSDYHFPVDVLKEAAQLGLAAMVAAPEMGGSGLSRLDAALVFKELASGCVSTAAYLSIHNMVVSVIDKYASGKIKREWGEKLAKMAALASYCLTEPNAGSDAASLKTTARIEGDNYIVNGTKAFISGAGVSDVYLCMVRTGDESYKGISALLIDKSTPGLSFGENEKKLGWHSQPTRMVFFDNCRVPKTNLIGEPGKGFNIALNALNGGRINIASCSLGGAKQALKITNDHMSDRKQFGKRLQDFQALRFKYADMLTQYQAAELMVYKAASALDSGVNDAPMLCAMAKRFATDACFMIVNEAMQIFGGYGYLNDYPLERLLRDLRVHQILEGTNEIMREIIGKSIFKDEFEIS